jgi:hypothetical protein
MYSRNIGKSSTGNAQFNAWRRQYFDEILFGEHLRPVDKLVALALLHFVNRDTHSTYVNPLTVAKAIGVKHPAVLASVERLVADKRLCKRKRGDFRGTDLELRNRDDAVWQSMKGSHEY